MSGRGELASPFTHSVESVSRPRCDPGAGTLARLTAAVRSLVLRSQDPPRPTPNRRFISLSQSYGPQRDGGEGRAYTVMCKSGSLFGCITTPAPYSARGHKTSGYIQGPQEELIPWEALRLFPLVPSPFGFPPPFATYSALGRAGPRGSPSPCGFSICRSRIYRKMPARDATTTTNPHRRCGSAVCCAYCPCRHPKKHCNHRHQR
jgi:hypothetical protein